jgi:lipopolysaccharide exporter
VLAMVWGQLALAGSKSAILLCIGLRRWRPQLRLKWSDLDGYLSFGLYQMGGVSINYVNLKLDQLLIGSIAGATALGYYNFAWNLVAQPTSKINPIVTRIAFPVFSKLQHDDHLLKRGLVRVQSILSFTNAPILFGLMVVAPTFVPIFFGKQWEGAVLMVQLLALVSLMRSLGNPVGALLLAKGRADLGFRWNLGLLIVQAPVLFFSVHAWGIVGTAYALLCLQVCYFVLSYFLLIERMVGPCFRSFMMSVIPALALSTLMAAAVLGMPLVTQLEGEMLLMSQVSTGAILYLLLTWVLRNQFAREMRALVMLR